ncbi:hypothetical protein PG989_000151 [Apiospora arundinis]
MPPQHRSDATNWGVPLIAPEFVRSYLGRQWGFESAQASNTPAKWHSTWPKLQKRIRQRRSTATEISDSRFLRNSQALLTWPSEGRTELSVRIRQYIVAGDYLLRGSSTSVYMAPMILAVRK